MDDRFLFGVLPYMAAGLCLVGLAVRAFWPPPTPTYLSDQRRALRALLWSSVSWRVGICGVLLGHLVGLLIPHWILVWNQQPLRLVLLEGTGLALGLLAVIGLALTLLAPRWCRRTTPLSTSDTVLLTLLAILVVSGLGIAVLHRWGSSWYASMMVPYLRSLGRLSPSVGLVADMPFLVKLHVVSTFALLGALPFTRLGVLAALLRPARLRAHRLPSVDVP